MNFLHTHIGIYTDNIMRISLILLLGSMQLALGKHLVQAGFAGTCGQRCSLHMTHIVSLTSRKCQTLLVCQHW